MRDWCKEYPPYEGAEPYLYLAFVEADKGKVWEFLRLLLARGCRVWYARGQAGSPEELLRRQVRYKGAALTLLYLTDRACGDPDTKSAVLVNQKAGRPILCIDPDGKDRRLAMGLREDAPHISVRDCRDSAQLEDALLHADGFSQDLIGDPVQIRGRSFFDRLTLLFGILAAVLLLFFVVSALRTGRSPSAAEDEVTFSDSVILTAVRKSAGRSPLTEESVSEITSVTLDSMPQSWEDLALLPSLREIRIPQEALLGEDPLPEGDYAIILTGGGS